MDILAPVAGVALIWSVIALAKMAGGLRRHKKIVVGLAAAVVVAAMAMLVLMPHIANPDYSRGDTELRAMLVQ